MTTLRPPTSLRSLIIVLALVLAVAMVCLSGFTSRAYSHRESARGDSESIASKLFVATPTAYRAALASPAAPAPVPTSTTPIFLADAEKKINSSGAIIGGQISFWNITLGGTCAPSTDCFAAGTPASLTAQPVTGPANSDVDFTNDVLFDDVGDLMIANGGSGSPDFGNFACVPAGAVTTGSNNVTVLSNQANCVDDPVQLAFGSDRSVALINQGGGTPLLEAQFVLDPTYVAVTSTIPSQSYRDIPNPNTNPATGVLSVVALPATAANPAGSYVVSLTSGATAATNHLRIIHPDGSTVDFPQDASAIRSYLAYDPANNQLVAAANNGTSSHVTFWS